MQIYTTRISDMSEFPEETGNLSAWDYVVFAAVLAISATIGIYQAVRMKKATKYKGAVASTEFLLAGRNMSAFPVTLSLLASFLVLQM